MYRFRFLHDGREAGGKVVVICSIKTMSGIADAYASNLLIRAADVCLKEGRKLIPAVRETLLHTGHLRLMQQAAEVGTGIFSLVPSFYTRPQTLDELVTDLAGRILLCMGSIMMSTTSGGGKH